VPRAGAAQGARTGRRGACDVRRNLRAAVHTRHNAETLPASPPHAPLSHPTPGETEKTAAMLLSDMPLARGWDDWVTRAGFAGP